MDKLLTGFAVFILCVYTTMLTTTPSYCSSLSDIRARGELRHLGVPCARFVNQDGDGLDCAVMRRFAEHLGVTYTYVPTTWVTAFPDLTGGNPLNVDHLEDTSPIRGDVLCSGISTLPERRKFVLFSNPIFLTQVLLITKPDSGTDPIVPTGNIDSDVELTMNLAVNKTVYGVSGTCISKHQHPDLQAAAREVINLPNTVLASHPLPLIDGPYDMYLLDAASTLVALEAWPYSFKIIGPVTRQQALGAAFALDSVELRDEFNRFFELLWQSGEYRKLVQHYYPKGYLFFESFFTKSSTDDQAA